MITRPTTTGGAEGSAASQPERRGRGAAPPAIAGGSARLIQSRQRRHDGLGLLDDDHVPGGGNRDELGAGDSAAKCFAIFRWDHPIVLAPDDHGPGPDTVKPLGKAVEDRGCCYHPGTSPPVLLKNIRGTSRVDCQAPRAIAIAVVAFIELLMLEICRP